MLFVPPTLTVLRALIADLEDDLDVTIPAEVSPLLAAHARITAPEPYLVGPQVPLADLGPEDIVRWTTHRMMDTALQDTRVQAEQLLAAEVADHLTAGADDIIDQLRPAYDDAAAYFTAARKAGITETTTAPDLLDMPPKAVTAWRAAVAHVDPLAAIAAARIGMSRVLGLPPNDDGTGNAFAACFSGASRGWSNGADPATWLRLAASGLVLQHIDETDDLTRVVRVPLVPVDEPAWSA